MATTSPFFFILLLLSLLLLRCHAWDFKEATIQETHQAFKQNRVTSRQLVHFYLKQIQDLNPLLHAVIEVNPHALTQADDADRKRKSNGGASHGLQGIPILLKDNIATKDCLNTTAGSLALLGSVVPRDAGVVTRLRRAGAVILGKASLSEWSHFRSNSVPSGWCARSGQGMNPYVLSVTPCGSSSGSAIAVAANLAMVSLGTETDGSIICPSSFNAVVGIKPTVGLTSRAGVIPISPRQDTVGPICRTISDAVHVLDSIVGFDPRDKATKNAAKFIPRGGYVQFLEADGIKSKRLGIIRNPFFTFPNDPFLRSTYAKHFKTLREKGAILVDNLEIEDVAAILNGTSGEQTAMLAEFKLAVNVYLSKLVRSPVRSLKDLISFNTRNKEQEKIDEFGQELFLAAQATNGIGKAEKLALQNMLRLSRNGIEKLMHDKKLDAIITPYYSGTAILAIGGYPGISVPAGYTTDGLQFGICFGGLKGSEPKLIEIAYAFEQATKIRKPPLFKS